MSLSHPQTSEATSTNKKVVMETWGCQMNVADSEKMLGDLKAADYSLSDDVEHADLVVLNTCHIREKARHKVVSRLGRLREIQKNNPKLKIAVTGCVAQAEGKAMLKQIPDIDVLLGPGKIDQLLPLIEQHQQTGKQQAAIGFHDEKRQQQAPALKADGAASPTLTGRTEVSRFVNISQGCDNFCTFCVVPFTRGREISLTPDKVVAEVRGLLDAGAKEVTLLGQNVNSYGLDLVNSGALPNSDTGPFVDLLERVAQLDGLERLRFTTSNPHDFSMPLAELFQRHEALGRYIHLPVQSGDDTVLERMRRKVTAAEYFEKLDYLRSWDPEFAVSTDLIVGFPGETDAQFQATLDLVEKARFSFIYAFKYSPRKGTAAMRFKEQVPREVMDARLKALNELQAGITEQWITQEIGRQRTVLCHYQSKKEPDVYYGRTEQFRLVRIKSGRSLVGQVVPVRITEGNKTALVAEILD